MFILMFSCHSTLGIAELIIGDLSHRPNKLLNIPQKNNQNECVFYNTRTDQCHSSSLVLVSQSIKLLTTESKHKGPQKRKE